MVKVLQAMGDTTYGYHLSQKNNKRKTQDLFKTLQKTVFIILRFAGDMTFLQKFKVLQFCVLIFALEISL